MLASRTLPHPLTRSRQSSGANCIFTLRLRPTAPRQPSLHLRLSRRTFATTPFRLASRPPHREPITIRTTAREVSSTPIPTIFITRRYIISVVAAALLLYFTFSQTVPVTRRRSFNVFSDRFVEWWNKDFAAKIIEDVHRQGGRFLPAKDARTRAVHKVMQRLIPYSGMTDRNWEIFVIEDNHTANAFVIPGGKVFVHSGLLNVCQSEDALAAVLGHEIAHNVANHSGERLTQLGALWLFGGSAFFLRGPLAGAAGVTFAIAGAFSTLTMLEIELPLTRKQEIEADYVGLMMMAEACYDPRAAVGLWQRMEMLQSMKGQQAPPEYLSTHPANAHRITNMKAWMDEALAKRRASDCKGTTAFAARFKEALRRRQSHVPAPA